jgi:hypothetical protein
MATSTAPAWHSAYPQPRNETPNVVTRKAVLGWLKDGQKPGVDFLLIDLRRTDHEVRTPSCPFLLVDAIFIPSSDCSRAGQSEDL